jgi:hypothetical protein
MCYDVRGDNLISAKEIYQVLPDSDFTNGISLRCKLFRDMRSCVWQTLQALYHGCVLVATAVINAANDDRVMTGNGS